MQGGVVAAKKIAEGLEFMPLSAKWQSIFIDFICT
jgi:hypothetical protein